MLAVLIIAFIIFVFHVIQDFRYEDGKNVKVMFRSFSIKKMPLSHSFASIFLIVCIISTLQSQYLYESFWGNEGRYTGLFLLAIYVITFLFISRFLKLKKRYLNNPKFNKHTEREVVIWQDRRRKQKIKPSDRA